MRYFVDVFRLVYRWFFRYPVIGGVLALLLWIVSFNGLSGLGIPDLFWRIASPHSFFAGVGIALVFSIAIYIALLLYYALPGPSVVRWTTRRGARRAALKETANAHAGPRPNAGIQGATAAL